MQNRSINRSQRGFTLIEILVVVVILAVLAAVVVPNVLGRVDDSKYSVAITTVQSLSDNIDSYRLDTGKYPEELNALVKNPGVPKWNGPYIKNVEKIPNDPWDHPYIYKIPGDNGRPYDILSYGDDGQQGGKDIQSWNLKGE